MGVAERGARVVRTWAKLAAEGVERIGFWWRRELLLSGGEAGGNSLGERGRGRHGGRLRFPR